MHFPRHEIFPAILETVQARTFLRNVPFIVTPLISEDKVSDERKRSLFLQDSLHQFIAEL
jgi:hypothetical protein